MNYPYFTPTRVKLQSITKKNPDGDRSPVRKSALGLTPDRKPPEDRARRRRLNPGRRTVEENRAAR